MVKAFEPSVGVASLLVLALLASITLGDQPASAGTHKPISYTCSSSAACVTATNSSLGPGTQANSASLNGVQGNTNSNGAAVYGESDGDGTGVTGRATGGFSDFAVFGDGGSNGGVPLVMTTEYNAAGATLLRTRDDVHSTVPLYADNEGNVQILGFFYSAGMCQDGCAGARRKIVSYESREPIATTEDVGEATLRGGEATVALDAALTGAIDSRKGYTVFLTAEGDTNGLYVARKTPSGFVVHETHGGHDTLAFAYRIVAQRRGIRSPRLPFVTVAPSFHAARRGVAVKDSI